MADAIPVALDRGESLLWSGSPHQGILLRPSDLFMIPFSFLWAGFAFFWEASVLADGAPGFFALWGIPFVLVGVYVVIGRFLVDARIRRNTSYAVTADRVIIRSGLLSPSTKSLNVRSMSDLTLNERKDGSGTIG